MPARLLFASRSTATAPSCLSEGHLARASGTGDIVRCPRNAGSEPSCEGRPHRLSCPSVVRAGDGNGVLRLYTFCIVLLRDFTSLTVRKPTVHLTLTTSCGH